MPNVHMQLVPTGAEFRASMSALPESMADHPSQLHVDFEDSEPRAKLEQVAWDQLAWATHRRRYGHAPLGFIDHVIEQDGRKLRVIRVLFPN